MAATPVEDAPMRRYAVLQGDHFRWLTGAFRNRGAVMVIAFWRTVCSVLLLSGIAAMVGAQIPRTSKKEPERQLVIRSVAGEDLYRFYCASCHKLDLKGGPARIAGNPSVPDLTLLSVRNGGQFPQERVHDTIARGGAAAAHRTGDMPVWGSIFRGLDPSEAMVDVRITNLVQYVASMQQMR
jgi:mono/diheme cytochrome c family protein